MSTDGENRQQRATSQLAAENERLREALRVIHHIALDECGEQWDRVLDLAASKRMGESS